MIMKTKICLTTLEYPPDVGGVGESVSRIAKMLQDLGYEVHVAVFHSKLRKITDKPKRTGCKTNIQDGITVHRLKAAIRTELVAIQDYLCEIYAQLKILHQQYQFDLFHAFFINETGFLTTMLAKEFNLPVINSIRGNDLHKHIFDPKQQAKISWTLSNSDWTTFVSGDLQRRAEVFVPQIIGKSTCFWNSIVPIDFETIPQPTNLPELRGLVIGSVGRFRDKKGIDFLIDACVSLKDELEFTLLLIGDFVAKEREYWLEVVGNSGIADRITITGILPRVEALGYLQHIDLFAIPSIHDGCPNAMLEAMLAGKAILGSTVDAIGDILDDGVDSLLVPPADAKAIRHAIRQFARHPEQRQAMGEAARRKVLEQLAPEVERQNWSQVYERVLSRRVTSAWPNAKVSADTPAIAAFG